MGCVLPAGLKQGPARQAMRQAGLPDSTGAVTINKLCGSGMKAVMQAADMIKAGSAQIVVAGGMESMTNAPYVLTKARAGYRMGHGDVKDHMFLDGLEDAETGRLMGSFAQIWQIPKAIHVNKWMTLPFARLNVRKLQLLKVILLMKSCLSLFRVVKAMWLLIKMNNLLTPISKKFQRCALLLLKMERLPLPMPVQFLMVLLL